MYSVYFDKLKHIFSTIEINKEALKNVEEEGIVYLDEIDKLITPPGTYTGKGVSTEGVQRDLLPIV